MKISIIISNYNKGKYLNKCLLSCINQEFNNYEIIIVDDNSTDNSLKIINKFKKKIKLIKRKKNLKFLTPANRQIKSLEKGFQISKGNIICLLDSDDFFSTKKLKIINKIFKEKKIQFLINQYIGYVNQTNKIYLRKKNKNYLGDIWPNNFQTSALSFRRQFFKDFLRLSKKKNYYYLEIDARLTIFASFYYNSLVRTTQYLSFWRLNSVQLSTITKKFSKRWFLKRNEAFDYLKYLLKIKNKKFIPSFDYYITTMIVKLLIIYDTRF
jgi:glycosyltransferase involved in cell wall biosynthesis|tara:strand:+ start:11548 stop:12351 length:804 start_codon:yes stop_codon:yes gene_type:complete